jgi:hypothetical protein
MRLPERPDEATGLTKAIALYHDSIYDCYQITELLDFHKCQICCNHWPVRRNITIKDQWIS